MRSVGIYTLGCKVNTYESEYIMGILKDNGYIIKDFDDICDVYIINTCTVTNNSDSKSGKIIRQAIRRNNDACIVAMGCFIESHKDDLIDGIDIVIGNKDKVKIIELLDKYFEKKEKIIDLYNDRYIEFEDMEISDFPGRTRAFIKIQDGCDNFCSYCIIPFVRGSCRSKKLDTVIDEVKKLVNNGYHEIVLTGIHTGSYGRDLNISFADLLKSLINIVGLERIRISSIECTELNEDVLDVIRNSKVIVDHLHIPIQAGSNEILKLMNRKYDLDYYENKIKEIRSIREDIAISTDIIVGFPGETEELFMESYDTCRRIGFSKLHVFPYSDRHGTKASKMSNKVDNGIKKERARRLIELSKELEIDYMNTFIGKELSVLIEESDDNYSYGHTGNYLYVRLDGKYDHNKFYNVKIEKVDYPYVIGK